MTVVISATDVTAARQNAGMVNHLLRSARTIAFVGTDLTGRITLFNTGAEHMLGVDADAATGRELVDFMAREDLARNAPHAVPTGRRSRPSSTRLPATCPPRPGTGPGCPAGRPPMKVSMTTNPVTDTFGDLFGYLFVASDITDTHRSQEILVKALHREREVVTRLKDLDTGQGRLRHHGQPRAAYADEQHHRQRGDAHRRHCWASSRPSSRRCSRSSRATATDCWPWPTTC